MAEYRLYQLDTADHIVTGFSVHCLSDRAALAAASRLAQRVAAVEVWQETSCCLVSVRNSAGRNIPLVQGVGQVEAWPDAVSIWESSDFDRSRPPIAKGQISY